MPNKHFKPVLDTGYPDLKLWPISQRDLLTYTVMSSTEETTQLLGLRTSNISTFTMYHYICITVVYFNSQRIVVQM